jgi:gliding motility-associated-like protein
MKLFQGLILFVVAYGLSGSLHAQCIVINEIMINPAGPCDGSCSPNTEEWVELYNTCDEPVDLGCWSMGDGDFTVVFPQGTVIPANGYFVIGSVNSGPAVDIDLGTCGCTSGSGIGIYTNGNEQVILANENEGIEDAIYWGGGQFPATLNAPALAGCNPVFLNVPNASSAVFEQLPGGGGQGCSIARACDGSENWEERCGSVTMGASNGTPAEPLITSGPVTICAGECIAFNGDADGDVDSWEWTFPGTLSGTSDVQSPDDICYDTQGVFDVQLTISNGCGSFSTSASEWVTVQAAPAPVIAANGPTTFCPGQSVVLTAQQAFPTYQWYLNNAPVAGETDASIEATLPGSYAVLADNGTCSGFSNQVLVNVSALPAPVIAAAPPVICEGEFSVLTATAGYESYQWSVDGVIQPLLNSAEIEVNTSGSYSVAVSSSGCAAVSEVFAMAVVPVPSPVILADGPLAFCEGETVVLTVQSAGMVQWSFNGTPVGNPGNASVTASQSGAYAATLVDQGCTGTSDAWIVEVFPLPSASIVTPDGNSACEGQTVQLIADDSEGVLQWFFNGAVVSDAEGSIFQAEETGTYGVTVSGDSGCVSPLVTVNVSILSPPVFSISSSDLNPCEGETVLLSVPQSGSVQWSTGSSSNTIQVNGSGFYTATVSVAPGCSGTDSLEVIFIPMPVANAGNDVISACDGAITLHAEAEGGIIQWIPASAVSDPTSPEPIVNPEVSTTYTLIVANGECVATDEVTVVVDCQEVFIPNAFTPDGDGLNDAFRPVTRGVQSYHLIIFDRWGGVVFETDDPGEWWIGNVAGGSHYAEAGAYTYRLKLRFSSSIEDLVYTGHIVLIR